MRAVNSEEGEVMMVLLGGWLMVLVAVFCFTLTVLGTLWTLRHLKKKPLYMDAPFNLQPVSILKPLKGFDPDLEENLESYFQLRYPKFEILFSVAHEFDPAVNLVRRLMKTYPKVSAQLIVGDIQAGPNPKVNNLIKSYEQAKFDWLLISDSNTRVNPDHLKRMVAHLDSSVGVMTALVAGRGARSFGAMLEGNHLNTFYARWMVIASRFGRTCVIGKSMIFRRSVADRFGGIRTLAKFIAEDYMTGEAMRNLGMKVIIMYDPIRQQLGESSFEGFWKRHIRWGRIRKAHAPLWFLLEPLCGVFVPAVLGALGFFEVLGINPLFFFVLYTLGHLLCDLMLIKVLAKELNPSDIWVWVLREFVLVPLWTKTILGRTIEWRGQKLIVQKGGLVEVPSSP